MSQPLTRPEVSILSPLRYPGAKKRLAGFIAEALRLNGLKPRLFVEPFAGGASVTLQLLDNDLVEQAALGERDPLVASFWKVVFYDSDWLIDRVRALSVTLAEWDRFHTCPGTTDRERALACLFLNRTSFSGILAPGAGPIGGRRQTSPYPLHCRFNSDTIIKRIRQAAKLAPRVLVVQCDSWEQTLQKVKRLSYRPRDIMYYFDPPFYNRAERLYAYYFNADDHRRLHDAIVQLHSPWILSYDPAPSVINMYSDNGRRPRHVELLYSLRGSSSPTQAKELVVSNLRRLPTRTRLWRSAEEWESTTVTGAAAHPRSAAKTAAAFGSPTG